MLIYVSKGRLVVFSTPLPSLPLVHPNIIFDISIIVMSRNNRNHPNLHKLNKPVTPIGGTINTESARVFNAMGGTHNMKKGWKYYAGLTGGIFIGAMAANLIIAMIFKANRPREPGQMMGVKMGTRPNNP